MAFIYSHYTAKYLITDMKISFWSTLGFIIAIEFNQNPTNILTYIMHDKPDRVECWVTSLLVHSIFYRYIFTHVLLTTAVDSVIVMSALILMCPIDV